MQDVRYALRGLRKNPAFCAVTVLTLALGVGGTTAAYGIARKVLFDPLPYAHAHEVGIFWKKTDWTEQEFLYIRGRVPGFRQVALYRQRDAILGGRDQPARLVPSVVASSELFDVLGVRPLLGRGFRSGDDVRGAEPTVVLSFRLWQDLGGNPSIIGTRVTLDGQARTVIGVMPGEFWFPDPAVRVWTSVPLNEEASATWNSTIIGRVASGHNVRAMETPVVQLTRMLDERFDYLPQWDKTRNARVTPLRDDFTQAMRPALLATLAAMALILLIACANVAALMLGQLDARSVELAVRSALGATRQRLTQPLIIEVLIIATIAGALGAALAWNGFAIVSDALPLGTWTEFSAPDWRVFASAMTFAMAAALLVILVPTVALHRGNLRNVLSTARTGGIEGRGGRLENGLVIVEVGLAVLIAIGGALLVRSVANLYAVNPNLRTEGIAVVDVMLGSDLNRARKEQTLNELSAALLQLPGVASVGAAQKLPLRGGGYNLGMRIEGRPDLKGLTSEYRIVTPGYLESLGIALRQGRTITNADRRDTERVVVINEALAQRYFDGVDPIGKLVGGDVGRTASRIVGVVANAAERQLTDAAQPVRYVAVAQMPWVDEAQSLVIRTTPGVDEISLLTPTRQTIARLAPGVAVRETTTMSRVLDVAIGPARQVVVLLSLLTGLALLLGAVGIYGVMAHFAARRQRDWAIRMALGLPGSRVIGNVIGHGAFLVTAGIGVGVVSATGVTRLLSALLYEVPAIDLAAFTAAGATLLLVGVLAALVPAWRAARTDPLIALREQ
jgi:predicted permease